MFGVVAGSKACTAGYSAVQAYITAVWAYYRHIIGGVGREGKGRWGGEVGKREGRRRGGEEV